MTPYPLSWPPELPRTKSRQPSQFKTSLPRALDNVEGALRAFGKDSGSAVSEIVLSSNVALGKERPADPGVAAWFRWDNEPRCIAVDRYGKVEDNLQAIYHIVEARRTELRHGGLHIVRQSFAGFKALPSPANRSGHWRDVLGFPAGYVVDVEAIEKTFLELAKRDHPDKPTGSHEKMTRLTAARDAALKEIGNG